MTLQQLAYLVAVAECGSITDAAERLFISQPSLSAAIHNLEKEMGVTAFVRSNKGVAVTREGEELLSFARMLLEQADIMQEHFGAGRRRDPRFCVSCQHYSFAVNAFVDVVQQYDADRYSFILRETQTGEIIDDVIVMHMADGLYWVSDLYGPRLLPWIEQHKGGADIHAKIITYDWDMYAVQGPDSLKAMNAMLDAPVDDLKRFGICERKLGDIPVYIHRSGFTGENGYEIYSAFDKSAEVHDLALKAVASVGGRELQTLEVYVRSIPMEKGFALKQDFKHLSPYECGLGWAVAADKDFIGKEAALARKEHPKYRMVGLEFSRESTEDISIWERVYWYGVEVGRCAQTIYGYTVDKNIGFATVRADVPDGAELTVGCNDSPAVVVNKVFC